MQMTDSIGDDNRRRLPAKPLNALIAEAIGFQVWQDPRPDRAHLWWQERPHPSCPGMRQIGLLPDYIDFLKRSVEIAILN
jgi:hypothetical protein